MVVLDLFAVEPSRPIFIHICTIARKMRAARRKPGSLERSLPSTPLIVKRLLGRVPADCFTKARCGVSVRAVSARRLMRERLA